MKNALKNGIKVHDQAEIQYINCDVLINRSIVLPDHSDGKSGWICENHISENRVKMKDQVSIPEIDFEYKLWKNTLDYFEKHLSIYRNRILALKTDNTLLANDYLNDIKDMILRICALKKEIIFHEEEIGCFKKDYPISRTHEHYTMHEDLKERLENLTNEYHTLLKSIDGDLSSILYV